MPRIILLENPNVMFCKYGTTTGSIIPSRQRNANVRGACFQSSGVYPIPDCPVANSCASSIPQQRPNFRLERNLLHRDEVVRKWSSNLLKSVL